MSSKILKVTLPVRTFVTLCASLLGCPRSGEGAVPGEEMGPARGAANGIRRTRHGITTRGQVCCVQRGRTKKGE